MHVVNVTHVKCVPVSVKVEFHCCYDGISLSLHFNGHFPDGTGLAGTRMFPLWISLEVRVMEVVVTTGFAKLQSKCRHQQTNT